MAKWSAGFATRAGAERASKWGGFACFLQAGRGIGANVVIVSSSGRPVADAIARFAVQSLVPFLFIVGGIQLWRQKEWIAGSLAALFVMFELMRQLLTTHPDTYTALVANFTADPSVATNAALIASFIVNVGLLILILNGLRGVFALRKVDKFTAGA